MKRISNRGKTRKEASPAVRAKGARKTLALMLAFALVLPMLIGAAPPSGTPGESAANPATSETELTAALTSASSGDTVYCNISSGSVSDPLTIPSGVTLINNGALSPTGLLTNSGTLTNNGHIHVTSTFTNDGMVTNTDGLITIDPAVTLDGAAPLNRLTLDANGGAFPGSMSSITVAEPGMNFNWVNWRHSL